MRCMCQNCGEYMVQDEKGVFSRCICPNCLQTCSACMGTAQRPLSARELSTLLAQRVQYDDVLPEDAPGDPSDDGAPDDPRD